MKSAERNTEKVLNPEVNWRKFALGRIGKIQKEGDPATVAILIGLGVALGVVTWQFKKGIDDPPEHH